MFLGCDWLHVEPFSTDRSEVRGCFISQAVVRWPTTSAAMVLVCF